MDSDSDLERLTAFLETLIADVDAAEAGRNSTVRLIASAEHELDELRAAFEKVRLPTAA